MKRLEWLEAMRGLAASWVLLHHSGQAVRDFAGFTPWHAVINGYLGVDFFFILSGFIIAHSSQQMVSAGQGWRDYALARVLRIYIPYLPIGVAILLLLLYFPDLSAGNRPNISLLTSLTLLPSNSPPALSVAWTLVHEILFYAVFSVFFISRPALLLVLVLWAVAIAWVAANKLPITSAAAYIFSPINLCFMLGVALEFTTRSGVSNRIATVAAILGIAFVGSQALEPSPNHVLVSLGFAGLVSASRSPGAVARTPGAVLLLLGGASYSIYLVHNPVISLTVRAMRDIPSSLVIFAAVSIAGVLAGLAYHFWYEVDVLRWARRTANARVRGVAPASTQQPGGL